MCSCRRDSTTRRSVAGRTSFRSPPSAATAPTLAQADVLRYEGVTPAIADGLKQLGDAGIGDGSFAKILFNAPGFALAYAWHKSDFPLPLHSHDSDCLYLVLAGEMRFGKEVLGQGDGAFVPGNTPYTFVTGSDGVEFLEFRNATAWKDRKSVV